MEGRQVGGDHYSREGQPRWQLLDFAVSRKYSIIQFQMLKYLDRYDVDGGIEDLNKLQDYLGKCISDAIQKPHVQAHEPIVNRSHGMK
jgi:hypothetical protein